MKFTQLLGSYALGRAILLSGLLLVGGCDDSTSSPPADSSWALDEDGIIRGSRDSKELALIFTGGDYGEGTAASRASARQSEWMRQETGGR